ncbi:dethiobiotin synthase [Synechococcus sp. PCC 7502]|uniref:dethiobiotin synthase n=1 Tax=Synechococcus sp. PCC 7502 TaxID=1173263 RepID=UPI00029FF209|nr:dethiobiotin synthase [Synechococcus sp. PCC 7502]AFY72590.1 dethiobiotin synthase [Synechococcus sp. PCC 7502]
MQPLLIVGSDTGVGKTVLTSSLAAYQQIYRSDSSLAIYKPVQSGVGDREYFHSTFKLTQSLEEITPIFFTTPIAPAIAMFRENKPLDLGLIWQHFQTLQNKYDRVLVEALGGLGSPITYEYTVADLAKDWHIETVLVVSLKLGAIAQAVANVALARMYKIKLRGIVLSCSNPNSDPDTNLENNIEDFAPVDLIQALTSIPVLGVLPYISDLSNIQELASAASNLDLETLGI